jgi:hypothetical protein
MFGLVACGACFGDHAKFEEWVACVGEGEVGLVSGCILRTHLSDFVAKMGHPMMWVPEEGVLVWAKRGFLDFALWAPLGMTHHQRAATFLPLCTIAAG